MESSCSTKAGGQPPTLPAKQCRHRSLSSRGSTVSSDCVPLSPGLHPPNYNDVFESPDCHAVSCPIHQHLDVDSMRHEARFFSDGTPPPVPKKRLVRTLSLPADHIPAVSPQPPHPIHLHNFDNPLYMLTPFRDTNQPSQFGAVTKRGTTPQLPVTQLSFDTSDEHLVNFFANFEDHDAVSQAIQHCHLLFLRDKAQNIEADVLLKEELSEKHVSTYQPQNFLLDEGSKPRTIVGTVFYSVHSSKFPERTLGLRICSQTENTSSACTRPLHVNVKHTVAYFQPTGNMKDPCLKTQALDFSSISGCTAANLSSGGTNEYANYSGNNLVSTVQHLLWKGHSVSVERDFPSTTLKDFVEESRMCSQNMDCVSYDKRLCFLLLQILQGTKHVDKHNSSAPSLIPSEILLVWPGIERRSPKTSGGHQNEALHKTQVQTGHLHMLWDTQGCPRVVVSPQTAASSASPSFGALIQYCLNVHEGLAALYTSPYRKTLLYVASRHKDSSSSVNINEMINLLQMVLWGPTVSLLTHKGMSTVHSWLAMKRALFVMKLAEMGVDQATLDWEDFLCLQYVAFTEPETVANVTSFYFNEVLAGEWHSSSVCSATH